MLQEAQVGVGISGREGQQAVNNSDFAIAQFRFLKPLLMVHGRWNYRRQSKVVLYSFYKNIVLVLTLSLFAFYSGFSGTASYEDTLIAGFNFFLGNLLRTYFSFQIYHNEVSFISQECPLYFWESLIKMLIVNLL